MSLRFRLIALICGVLAISLTLDAAIAYSNATRSVRTEMRAALLVGRQTIENAVERLQNARDPSRGLEDLIASFKGNRHLRVTLSGQPPALAAPSVEKSAFGGMPGWFAGMIGVAPEEERVRVAVTGGDHTTIVIETDPYNETLEVWNEFTESLVAPAVFCALTIALIYVFIGRALQPLSHLAAALEEIGDGRYRTRISARLAPELRRLRDSFNRMAARLAEADAENRRLNQRLVTLQEQERGELARDLHDEVGPYLFAINADAATASRLLNGGRAADADEHIQLIAEAIRHMQRQVRQMLGRLRPIGLAEFGLREAVENLVAFWRRRRPEICYRVAISAECDDLDDVLATAICRIVQEALSNAVRHASPSMVTISIERDCDEVRLAVSDDGPGMAEPGMPGYGLVGIRERISALGGRFALSNGSGEGLAVTAVLPWPRMELSRSCSVQAAEP